MGEYITRTSITKTKNAKQKVVHSLRDIPYGVIENAVLCFVVVIASLSPNSYDLSTLIRQGYSNGNMTVMDNFVIVQCQSSNHEETMNKTDLYQTNSYNKKREPCA